MTLASVVFGITNLGVAYYSTELTHVYTSDDPSASVPSVCGPDYDVYIKPAGEAFLLWFTMAQSFACTAYAMATCGFWFPPSSSSSQARWYGSMVVTMMALTTGQLLARSCLTCTVLWYALLGVLLGCLGSWAVGCWSKLVAARVGEVHFELASYLVALYMIWRAPVGRFCEIERC